MTYTTTKTYSHYPVKDCRDCPGAKVNYACDCSKAETDPFDVKFIADVACTFSAARAFLLVVSYQEGDVPAWCPLETGDVMVTRD